MICLEFRYSNFEFSCTIRTSVVNSLLIRGQMEKNLRVLAVNSGSSSIKFALYGVGEEEKRIWSGLLGGIGLRAGYFRAKEAGGAVLIDEDLPLDRHGKALEKFLAWLRARPPSETFDVVGHRLVHGGEHFTAPHRITPDLITVFEELAPLAPDHLPHEIEAVRAFENEYPGMEQIACFDTAFHRTMPEVAQVYPVARELRNKGILRYGFHGLSYEYLLQELAGEEGERAARRRIVLAHLGNGASMAAVRDGRSMDTTMGFSPAGGIVMSTRTGDLDPGVILYLLKEKGWGFDAVNRLVNKQGGLLGVSGISGGMEDLLRDADTAPQAALAVELFCYQARKFLGGLAAVLGGLDTLIFTGGIGENAPPIRRRICENLEFLGIHLDQDRNAANQPVISANDALVTVRVMKTNEELMIARHTYGLIRRPGPA